MIYFVNWDGDMSEWPAWYGILRSPRSGAKGNILTREPHRMWCADNDAFHGLFNEATFRNWLAKMKPFAHRCVFVTCPDVVADSVTTNALWLKWALPISEIGYEPAFVIQDGQEPEKLPGSSVFFLGGSTEFKMGAKARDCIAEAKRRLAWVHIGRVNSQRRLAYFASLGADSADGTTINRGPIVKSRMLSRQLAQRPLGLHHG